MKTKYRKELDILTVNVSPIKATNSKTIKAELEVVVELTTNGNLVDVSILNFKKQMANQIVINEEQVNKVGVGDVFTGNISGKTFTMMLIENSQYGSWNIIDMSTGRTLFGRDIRKANTLSQEIHNMDITILESVTLNRSK